MVEDEPVVLLERPPFPRGAQRGGLAVGDDRELERVVEARVSPGVTLAEDAAVLVHQGEAAVEVAADDAEQRLDAAPADDRVGEPLVHGQRARLLLELLVGEVREGGLRDRDEGHLVRDRQHGERELVRLPDDRFGNVGEPEADAEAEAGDAVAGEPPDVRALRGRRLAEAEPRGQQELAALEPPGRIGQLRDVEPADGVLQPLGARGHGQLEIGQGRQIAHRQHVVPFDTVAKRYAETGRLATGNPPRGPGTGSTSGLRRPCRPWRSRAR